MVNMIVNQQKKYGHYGSCIQTLLLLTCLIFLLSGCNMGIGSTTFTLKSFDDKNFQPIMQTIAATGWVLGLWLIVMGFFKLKIYGQARTMMSSHTTIMPPLMLLLIGTILLYLPFMTKVSLATIWGSNDVLAYIGKGDSAWTTYFKPIVHIMTIIGYISFIRGWMVLSKLGKEGGNQPGMASKGFMHILGGLLAINFLGTIDIIRSSFS